MIQVRKHSKTQQIVEAVRQRIDSGALPPNARLENVRVLGARFQAGSSVVNNALKILESQGYIARRPRSGVFVLPQKRPDTAHSATVLVSMLTSGHVWGDLFALLNQELVAAGFLPVVISNRMLFSKPTEAVSGMVRNLLKQNIHGAVVIGTDYWQNPILNSFDPQRSFFLWEVDYPELCGHGVLVDYEAAYYELTRHLIEQGCRRPALVIGPAAMRFGSNKLLHFWQMCAGYQRALREAGLEGNSRYLMEFETNDQRSVEIYLEGLRRESNPPDAILCYMDAVAIRVCRAADKLGIRVPEELAVTGFYNTPWVNISPLGLTTVNFDLEELVHKIVALVRNPPRELHLEYIKPQLRIGASSQRKP